ncbi:MAG: hypothetical protein IJ174_08110 [Clostridia bacterium]|nr:hypothetical protein [Clostridia bacterium]
MTVSSRIEMAEGRQSATEAKMPFEADCLPFLLVFEHVLWRQKSEILHGVGFSVFSKHSFPFF